MPKDFWPAKTLKIMKCRGIITIWSGMRRAGYVTVMKSKDETVAILKLKIHFK
jgi:hypothetical protein